MSDFTDHSSLYHLSYEILGVRLGFDVLSLLVLAHHLLLSSRFQVKDLLLHFGQCTLVMLRLTILIATDMHVTIESDGGRMIQGVHEQSWVCEDHQV